MRSQGTDDPSRISPIPLNIELVRPLMNIQSFGTRGPCPTLSMGLCVSQMRLSFRTLGLLWMALLEGCFPASVNGLYCQESSRLNQDSGRPSGIGYMQMNHSFSDTCAPACD